MLLTSHRGEYIAQTLENNLLKQGIKNVFTITIDNASLNDNALSYFKKKLLSWGGSMFQTQYVHIRCMTHILNLIVNDGLKDVSMSVSVK